MQRLLESESGERCMYFDLSCQFDGHLYTEPQELASYYSNHLSDEEVEGLLKHFSGQDVLSDQHIEQLEASAIPHVLHTIFDTPPVVMLDE